MLGLKLKTDPRWANIAEDNLEEILTDHAWCEQKAATNAMHLIINNPQYTDMVTELIQVAREELEHFEMVHEIIKERGYALGIERADDYVGKLAKFLRKGHAQRGINFIDRLLFAAMIEARSCERFKVLSEQIKDEALAKFYHELMVSEAGHYTLFLKYARKYGNDIMDVEKRWQEWVEYETSIIVNYGKEGTIHG